jgi:HD-GYP domain-containing protein (c-di-GMP phosphodiesterase class II)
MTTPTSSDTSGSPRGWLIGLALLVLAALAGAWWLADRGQSAELAQVRAQAELVSASRAQAVNQWVADQRRTIETLADNPAVQIYVASLVGGAEPAIVQGQSAYLRSLLQAAAERGGFLEGVSQVPANVARVPAPGLAVIGPSGQMLVEAGGPLPLAGDLIGRARSGLATDGTRRLDAGPVLSIVAPIMGQGGAPIAYLYGVRLVDAGARALLLQPGEAPGTAEVALLALEQTNQIAVTARSGLAEGSRSAIDALTQAAILTPGTAVSGRTAGDVAALATAAQITGVDWWLLRVAPAAASLEPIAARGRLLFLSLAGAIGFVALGVLLVWRHATSVRLAQAKQAAEAARDGEAKLRRFLTLVADRQPTAIAVVQADGSLSFANARLGQPATLAQAFGPAAPDIADLVEQARAGTVGAGLIAQDATRWQVQAIDLAPDGDGVLVVAEDVSELIAARERKEHDLTTLIATLTDVIDARDPGSARHSARVASTAASVAQALGLESSEVATARTAGQLMNLGKIMVPRALLTRQGPLSAEERAQVAQAYQRSADILASVPFEGPVAATIAALDEPATGAAGRLPRLLRLVNAFVGMTSPRAHRPALGIDDALTALRASAEPDDQPILSALSHWLDNQGGRAAL